MFKAVVDVYNKIALDVYIKIIGALPQTPGYL
jgi:hypothetical protein